MLHRPSSPVGRAVIERLGWIRRLAGRRAPARSAEFDPDFYRQHYPDLAKVSDAARLRTHYDRFGQAEGRFPTPAALIQSLERAYGALPAHFDAEEYGRLNPDLAGLEPCERTVHYLEHGRAEGRAFSAFDPQFYGGLYFPGESLSIDDLALDYAQRGRERGLFGCWRDMLHSFGVADGAWRETFDVGVVRQLAPELAREPLTQAQAVHLLLSRFPDRAGEIISGAGFEADYYRETHPALEGLSDEACYRRWLAEGLADGEPGSAVEHLRRLGLLLDAFPSAFHWRRYAQLHPDAAPNRWRALESFLERGFRESGARFVAEAGRTDFLSELGRFYLERDGKAAVQALELADRCGSLPVSARMMLADAYAGQALWSPALAQYRQVLKADPANVAALKPALAAASALERHAEAVEMLRAMKPAAAQTAAWRALRDATIARFFEQRSEAAQALLADGRDGAANALLDELVEHTADLLSLSSPARTPRRPSAAPRPKLAILANRATEQGFRLQVTEKAELLGELGYDVKVFETGQEAQFMAEVAGASAAMFYRVAAHPAVIAAILEARRAGVATYYETDELIFAPEHYPRPIEAYHGLLTEVVHQNLRFGAPLYRGAMALCDYGVAPTASLARAMEPVVRAGTVFVVPSTLRGGAPPVRAVSTGAPIRLFCGCGELAFVAEGGDVLGLALAEIMQRHPAVQVSLAGHIWLGRGLEAFLDRITYHAFTTDPDQHRAWLAESDVNLVAYPLDPAGDAKSEIRWLEAAALGVPSVVSATRTAAEVLRDGETAFLARTTADWRRALEQLICDPGLRTRMGHAAHELAASRYGPEAGRAALQTMLAPLHERRPNRAAAL